MKRCLLLVFLLFLPRASGAGEAPPVWQVGPAEGKGGRVLFAADPMLLAVARNPDLAPDLPDTVTQTEDGKVAAPALANGWAYREIDSETARTVLLGGSGFVSVLVNGERFPGDVYGDGILRIPVPLRAGTNHILVRAIRGGFTISLSPAEGDVSLSSRDALLPDFREGERIDAPGAVLVRNQTGETVEDAVLEVGDGRITERLVVPVGPLVPYGIAKPAFPVRQLRAPGPDDLDPKGRYLLPVALRRGSTTSAGTYPIEIRSPGAAYRQTRISGIDGSVQYHAVLPPVAVEPGKRYGLFLSLHGAGVPAIRQARAYAAKRDAFLVAPTNRRRFGFDWQDWGRIDALEALAWARDHLPIDPDRIYLTGHSMGGHGTWYLGSLFASRFAAIAPSAGWASFFTYGGGMPRKLGDAPALAPLERSMAVNDTEAFLTNLESTPVYVLHGEKDDNVPLEESKHLVQLLSGFNSDHAFHVEPGAGHWWGNRCVDYGPLLDFCRRHRRVAYPCHVRFTTPDPAVVDRAAWVRTTAWIRAGLAVKATADADRLARTVTVTTENAAGLVLDLPGVVPGGTVKLTVDATELSVDAARPAELVRGDDGVWRLGNPPVKGGGPFRAVFDNRMVFVYGTHGTEAENAANLAQARFDAETFWYRGNGSVLVLPDGGFDSDRLKGRNVILYGNADTNSAYAGLLPDCPIRIARSGATLGNTAWKGEMGLYLVYPRPDGDGGFVGVVGATTAAGMRMLSQARYFTSGVTAPDWVVFSPDTLTRGMAGVIASGYFPNTWSR